MFEEQDYDEERLRPRAILFWGTVGPATGLAVVIADRAKDLLDWLRDRARVEGPTSWLARVLLDVERAALAAGDEGELAADAIGSELDEAGIPFYACGPLEREIAENELVRGRIWEETLPADAIPEGVWRGGEAHVEVEGSPVSPPEGDDDEPAKGYRLDEDIEELAEHAQLDLERFDHRSFLVERLEALKAPPPPRRQAA